MYMDISFAQDFGVVLRKHWCGEIPCTRKYFSCENPHAKPEMLVWRIGYASREETRVFCRNGRNPFYKMASKS